MIVFAPYPNRAARSSASSICAHTFSLPTLSRKPLFSMTCMGCSPTWDRMIWIFFFLQSVYSCSRLCIAVASIALTQYQTIHLLIQRDLEDLVRCAEEQRAADLINHSVVRYDS